MNGCVLSAPRFAAACIFLATALVACGGGGGGSSPNPSTPTSNPTASTTPTAVTNASGTVVNDANGAPLAGVTVKLMPWGNGPGTCAATPTPATSITPESDGCPTPLPSPQATTNASGQFTLNGAPNGHYLLIIGADTVSTPPPGYAPPACTNACGAPTAAPFTVQATVHDNVTLTGGNQTLLAPTLPPVPTITPPAWETNGDYRLATLDATTEMPCYVSWEYQRAQHSLAGSSVDEWTTENVREMNTYFQKPGFTNPPWTNNAYGAIASAGQFIDGGYYCETMIAQAFAGSNTYATDPRVLWFSGQFVATTAVGRAGFPVDPRSFADPNVSNWP